MKTTNTFEPASKLSSWSAKFFSGLGWPWLCLILVAWLPALNAATVTTDQSDYSPFTYVTITGTGFQPGEMVVNQVIQVAGPAAGTIYAPWTVQADSNGNFVTSWLVFNDDLIGTTLQMTSTGQSSGLLASTTFTDGISCPSLPAGTAPVTVPSGGFGIDGDLVANSPVNGIGDWFSDNLGHGGVLNASGCPLNSLTTYHLIDAADSSTDNNYSSGKADDNPNTWTWANTPVGNKVDVKHAFIHAAKDVNGHTWIIVAATRQSNNGDAYVDFEFLQNSLTLKTNADGISGSFSSTGPNGGRTINDFVLSITLTGGGTTPALCVYRWNQVGVDSQGNAQFDYTNSTASLPANAVFGSMNTAPVSIPNCYSNTVDTYAVNDFAEVAVDVTAMISGFDPCATESIGTILVKSKQSQSPNAQLGDFIAPQPVYQPFLIGAAVSAGPNQAKCFQGPSTSFNLSGTAQAGTFPLASTNWTVVSGYATIDQPSSLTPTVTVYGAGTNVTLRLSVTDSGTCANRVQHSDVVLTVNAPLSCSINGDDTTYDGSLGNTYGAPAGMATYAWSVSGNSGVTINGSSSAQNVKLDVAAGASGIAGSFTLNLAIIDPNGCSSTCQKTVTLKPLGCLVQGPSSVCAGSTGNQYSLAVQPGSATAFSWSISGNGAFNPSPASTATSVSVDAGAAGSFTVGVTITFNGGGTISCSIPTTVQQLALSLASESDVTCYGGNNGSFTASASGGTAPYSYSLDGITFQSYGTFGSLVAGNYSVTAKDASGCSSSLPITVGQPARVGLTATPIQPLCSTDTGSISASAGGGTGIISYTLDGKTFQPTGNFSGLVAGNYTVTAVDANGCFASAPVTITAPSAIILTATPIQPKCSTDMGSINALATGGTGAFTYSRDGSSWQNSGLFTGLASGPYTITAKDANGCTKTASVTINQAPQPIILSATPSQPKCGLDGGSINATATGGTGTISYSKDGTTFQSSGLFTGLSAGPYTITAKDMNGCIATTSATITAPPPIVLNAIPTQPLCSTDTGSIAASATGGTGTFTYSKDGTTWQSSGSFSGLGNGTYIITAKDSSGCLASTSITITVPWGITLTTTPTQPMCSADTGSISASAAGGTGSFTYSKDGSNFQNSGLFNGLVAGNYTITAKDANGCVATKAVTITAPSTLGLTATATQPKCSTDSGSINASASGGAGGYVYSVDGISFQTSGSFNGLAGGSYTVTAKDMNGCVATKSVSVNPPPAPVTLNATATQPLCSTVMGSINASASGGTGTILYSKDGTTFQASGLFNNLAAGQYTITAKDANGCTATTPVTINPAPAAILLTATPTQPLCNTGTGAINASATGGTGAITYSRDGVNFQSPGLFNNLAAGKYTITAMDANGCTVTTTVSITAPAAIALTALPIQPKCSTDTGSIKASASGGTGTITYSIDGVTFQSSGVFSGLLGGSFTVTAQDANGCTAASTLSINSAPMPLVMSLATVQPKCSTDTGTITCSAVGGVSPCSYSIDGINFRTSCTFSGLQPNNYTVITKDANGCLTTQSATIVQPSPLSCTVSGLSDVQVGAAGCITAMASGSTPPYSFSWKCNDPNWPITGTTLGTVGGSSCCTMTYNAPMANDTATFTVTTTDANGCNSVCTLTVASLPPSFVTDSSLCTFTSPFRLIFTQDPTNMPCFKLTASNPGQYYYNMTYLGTPGQQTATFLITLPYPFVTQGAQPIHAYDSVSIQTSGGQTCLTPGNPLFVSSDQVTLDSYGPNPIVGQTTYTFQETVPLSAFGYAYLNIHLDYGLKKAGGYAPGGTSGKDAVACSGSSVVPIPDLQADNLFYNFGYTVGNIVVNTFPGVQSANDFKKNAGAGGLVTKKTTGSPVLGAAAVLKDSKGNVLGTGTTDTDGWYVISYKASGKAATYYITVTPPNGAPQTQAITLKSNGYAESDFSVP